MVYDIGTILAQWESAGIFEFVFPLLLIFALVFGILQKTKIFDNKNINLVIAFVIGFMAIRLEFVRVVFSEITARGAVGVLILVMMLILVSMFIVGKETEKGWYVTFSIIAAIIFVVIVIQSFNFYGFGLGNYMGGDFIAWIVGAVILIGVIVALTLGSGEKDAKKGG